jgi:hypothetical protein
MLPAAIIMNKNLIHSSNILGDPFVFRPVPNGIINSLNSPIWSFGTRLHQILMKKRGTLHFRLKSFVTQFTEKVQANIFR